jgi:hypothetical protein
MANAGMANKHKANEAQGMMGGLTGLLGNTDFQGFFG